MICSATPHCPQISPPDHISKQSALVIFSTQPTSQEAPADPGHQPQQPAGPLDHLALKKGRIFPVRNLKLSQLQKSDPLFLPSLIHSTQRASPLHQALCAGFPEPLLRGWAGRTTLQKRPDALCPGIHPGSSPVWSLTWSTIPAPVLGQAGEAVLRATSHSIPQADVTAGNQGARGRVTGVPTQAGTRGLHDAAGV